MRTVAGFATLCVLCAALFPGKLRADAFGASDSVMIMKLSSIYAVLKEHYVNAQEVLANAKIHTQDLSDIKNFSREMYREYQFVRDFDGQKELKNIANDIKGLTYLDNLDGKSLFEKIRLIDKEISRRFGSGNQLADEAKKRLAMLERLARLQQAKTDEAAYVTDESRSDKDLATTTASSTALIAALMVAQEQRRVEEQMQALDAERERNETLDVMDQVFTKMQD
ncbi:MAG: hypothetical protein GY874_12960 [Desulfobacteraceae bacterium]|nr:hypothetical protein [Desulfobacteraceae bacterium]